VKTSARAKRNGPRIIGNLEHKSFIIRVQDLRVLEFYICAHA
jgi:hypothetical protein